MVTDGMRCWVSQEALALRLSGPDVAVVRWVHVATSLTCPNQIHVCLPVEILHCHGAPVSHCFWPIRLDFGVGIWA